MRHLTRRVRLGCQRGFTTVTLLGVLFVGGIVVTAAFAAVDPNIQLSREDQDYKQSYAAAEGGLQWYLSRLSQDRNFYVNCTNVSVSPGVPAPVNQRWDGSGLDPRRWRNLPGDASSYTVELIPAGSAGACVPQQQETMVDSSGQLHLRVTGRSRDEYRTVLATLKRRSFLNFIYFTDFETMDPVATSDPDAAGDACAKPRAERTSPPCDEIRFVNGDVVNGPLHTNDNVLVCGSPTFGRDTNDKIEIVGSPKVEDDGACAGTPHYLGDLVDEVEQLGLPPSNAEIRDQTQAAYLFTGRTQIVLNGSSMTVTTYTGSTPNTRTMTLPSNGVIYVQNSSCTGGYTRHITGTYPLKSGCGDAWVSGSYNRDLTIAADNDVIINGNLRRSTGVDGVLLGLIANNFVRVYHPVDSGCNNNSTGSLSNPTIDAAILALNHSFLVDNWDCGNTLGNLNVYGAIAQKFRGPVGTTGGTGYIKNYRYNDRLRFREPPYFLAPTAGAWKVLNMTEQAPPVRPLH
jgi:hypothetical protein